MSKNLNYKQANNVERRTWNLEHYESKAKVRAAANAEKAPDSKRIRLAAPVATDAIRIPLDGDNNKNSDRHPDHDDAHEEFVPADSDRAGPESSQRAFLKARSRRLIDKLDSKVGSTEFVTDAAVSTKPNVETSTSGGIGWHCKVCDCYLKDSLTYLDHINGRKHQRYLGYSMRAERSTLDDVKEKIKQLAESKQRNSNDNKTASVFVKYDNRSANNEQKADETAENKKVKDERARRRAERMKQESEEEASDDGIDPEIRAMMGFSSFAKGKK